MSALRHPNKRSTTSKPVSEDLGQEAHESPGKFRHIMAGDHVVEHPPEVG